MELIKNPNKKAIAVYASDRSLSKGISKKCRTTIKNKKPGTSEDNTSYNLKFILLESIIKNYLKLDL
jgi:hypothetical protein